MRPGLVLAARDVPAVPLIHPTTGSYPAPKLGYCIHGDPTAIASRAGKNDVIVSRSYL